MGSSVVDHIAEYQDVPSYHATGWYDSWGAQVANLNYVQLSKAKKSLQRLIVGPWTHGGQAQSFAGIAQFGQAAAVDMNAFRHRWFDRWLLGLQNGVDREPPVRLFVMGGGDAHKTPEGRLFVGGAWREEREWPLARTIPATYYLHADGALSREAPQATSTPTRYSFDPRNPVPTICGNVSSEGVLMPRGAQDQRCDSTLAVQGHVAVVRAPQHRRAAQSESAMESGRQLVVPRRAASFAHHPADHPVDANECRRPVTLGDAEQGGTYEVNRDTRFELRAADSSHPLRSLRRDRFRENDCQ